VLGFIAAVSDSKAPNLRFGLVSVVLFAVSWAGVLICFWFHPIHGALYNSASAASLMHRDPIIARRRAATFLVIFVIAGTVLIPLLVAITWPV
jgi:hypothetical protein